MKILIVDDHALFREGLCYVLNALEDQVNILEAENSTVAMQIVSENSDLDLVLLDLNMPGKNGFTVLTALTKKYPALVVVMLSASNQSSDIQRTINAGAMGYIPKETTSAVMLNALRLILSGGIYIPQAIAHDSKSLSGNNLDLTPRQLQVLMFLIQGDSNKEIGVKISITEATVKSHVTSILQTLGVSNRTQAAIVAKEMNFDSLPQ